MLSREQILIGIAGMIVAGLTGGGVVALAVRSEDKARAELPPIPEPALIRADGGERLATDTPTSALLELWSSAQWGDVPAILRLHDPVVRRAVGDTVITGVYAHQRARMVIRRPRVVDTDVGQSIAIVRYRLQGEPKATLPQLAIMRRAGRTWLLRFDTFVVEALPFYVTAANGGEVNPNRTDRRRGATTAAAYSAQAGRLAALPTIQAP